MDIAVHNVVKVEIKRQHFDKYNSETQNTFHTLKVFATSEDGTMVEFKLFSDAPLQIEET